MYKLAEQFIFLDLETTGLDPAKDKILEVGAIATTPDFEEMTRFHRVVRTTSFPTMSNAVYDMHLRSRLLDDCIGSDTPEAVVTYDLWQWIGQWSGKTVMAGNSIHFDERLIKAQMPDVASLFHYHLFDVSAHLRTFQLFGINIFPPKAMIHRSIQDCEWSLQGARNIKEFLSR